MGLLPGCLLPGCLAGCPPMHDTLLCCCCSPFPGLPALQMVTALPEIRKEALQPGDDFLLLACDGIWDVLTNQEVGRWCRGSGNFLLVCRAMSPRCAVGRVVQRPGRARD